MKKLYSEFFHIPEQGKIREKVMLTRVISTVLIMVVCLVAMSVTAYAYFSHNVTSVSSVIKAANFDVKTTVTNLGNNQPVVPSSTFGNKTTYTFANTGMYSVKLEKENGTTATTGFCIVNAGNQTYHTQQIGVDINANNENRDWVTFNLKINEPGAVVTIVSHWGTSSWYNFNIDKSNALYIMNDPLKVIEVGNPVSGVSDSEDKKESSSVVTPPPKLEPSPTPEPTKEPVQTPEQAVPNTDPAPAPETTVPETTETDEPVTTEPTTKEEPSEPKDPSEPVTSEPKETTEGTQPQTEEGTEVVSE